MTFWPVLKHSTFTATRVVFFYLEVSRWNPQHVAGVVNQEVNVAERIDAGLLGAEIEVGFHINHRMPLRYHLKWWLYHIPSRE